MTQDEKNVADVFNPFEIEPDPRVKGTSSGGYTKIVDGESVKMRVTDNIYRYWTVKAEGDKYPMMNNDLRELLQETTIDKLFEDENFEIRDRYALIVYNWTTKQAEVWQVSKKLMNQLKIVNQDEDWQGGLKANDVKVTRQGSGTDTVYSINYVKESNEITTEIDNQLLDIDVERMVAGAVKL